MSEEVVLVSDSESLLTAIADPTGVITIDDDFEIDEVVVTQSCVIDLNGHTLTASNQIAFVCKGQCEVTIRGDGEGSKLIGTIVCGAEDADGTQLTIDGGLYQSVSGQSVILIDENCSEITLTCQNAIFVSDDKVVFAEGGGTISLENCSVQGGTGIYTKKANILLVDTVVSADGEYSAVDGSSSTGDAIIVDPDSGYKGSVSVELDSECTIISLNGNAIQDTYSDSSKTSERVYELSGVIVGPVLASDLFKSAIGASKIESDCSEAVFTQPVSSNFLGEDKGVFQQVDGTYRVMDAETGLQETLFGTVDEIAQAKDNVNAQIFAPVNQPTVIDEVSRSLRDMNTIRAQKGEVTAVHSVIGKVFDIFRDVAKEEHNAEELQALKEKALLVYLTLYRAIETDGMMK